MDAKPDLIAGLQQLPMLQRWLRWAVLAASLAFSAASAYYFSIQVRQEAHSRFETVAVASPMTCNRGSAPTGTCCTRCVGCSTPRTR